MFRFFALCLLIFGSQSCGIFSILIPDSQMDCSNKDPITGECEDSRSPAAATRTTNLKFTLPVDGDFDKFMANLELSWPKQTGEYTWSPSKQIASRSYDVTMVSKYRPDNLGLGLFEWLELNIEFR